MSEEFPFASPYSSWKLISDRISFPLVRLRLDLMREGGGVLILLVAGRGGGGGGQSD